MYKQKWDNKRRILFWVMTVLMSFTVLNATAQNIIVNLATLEGVDITPDNIWGFQIQSMESNDLRCKIEGTLRYKNSEHNIRYSFDYTIKPGLNLFTADRIHPTWSFSSQGLRELFMDYKVLPEGTYQYCVKVTPQNVQAELPSNGILEDCLYKQSKDLFSINLIEPEDDAKLYEFNPLFTWVGTYPFQSVLTYRIRIAEVKDGQNQENAVVRNNPIYSENNLLQSTMAYPVYGKPLQLWQPYAWTVDAYYKGILLGGAQPWKFTIVEDSLYKSIPKETSYLDVRREQGDVAVYAVGKLKLKYILEEARQDTLGLILTDEKGNAVKFKTNRLDARAGDNRYEIDFKEDDFLKHGKTYRLQISSGKGSHYTLKFKYFNPDLLN